MTIKKLRKDNIDIKAIFEIKPGIKDGEVINITCKENRLVITFDRDFGFLVFKKNNYLPGILLLKFVPEDYEDCYNILLSVLKKKIDLYHKITVVDRNKIRQRSLPVKNLEE